MELEKLGWNQAFKNKFAQNSSTGDFPARVTFASRGHYRLAGEGGEHWAGLAGKLRGDGGAPHPVVGDWVRAREVGEGVAVINGVLTRESSISRGAPGSRKSGKTPSGEQVIAANVTKSFLVCGLDRDFNPRRIERYAAISWGGGVTPAVLLNKADLCDDAAGPELLARTAAPGVEVVVLSATDRAGVEIVRALIGPGDTVCLLGSSGAGKSTLLNALLNGEVKATGAVSGATGKGRHTTTDRELFLLPGGGMAIDTPGLREVALGGESSVEDAFPEIAGQGGCRYPDCTHTVEPGCRVRLAVEEGRIAPERFESYLKLQREARFRERAADATLAVAEKKKWKAVSKAVKRFYLMK